jgi:hypothetical protein
VDDVELLFYGAAVLRGVLREELPGKSQEVLRAFTEALYRWVRNSNEAPVSRKRLLELFEQRATTYTEVWTRTSGGIEFGLQAAENITGEANHRLAPHFLSTYEDFQRDLGKVRAVARMIRVTAPAWQDELHQPFQQVLRLKADPDMKSHGQVASDLTERIKAASAAGEEGLVRELQLVEQLLEHPWQLG